MAPTLYEGPEPTGKVGPTGLRKTTPRRQQDETRSSPMLVFGGIAVVITLAGYLYFRSQGDAQAGFNSIKQYLQLPDAMREKLGMKPSDERRKKSAKRGSTGAKKAVKNGEATEELVGAAPLDEEPFDPYQHTTLLLANGERVFGDLVSETAGQVVLKWEYGQATFKSSEIIQKIAPLSRAATASGQSGAVYQPGDPLTLTLHSGEELTGELVQELPDEWVIRFDFGEVNFKKTEVAQIQPSL